MEYDLELTKKIARRMAKKFQIEYDEVLSIINEEWCKQAQNFSPERGNEFNTYFTKVANSKMVKEFCKKLKKEQHETQYPAIPVRMPNQECICILKDTLDEKRTDPSFDFIYNNIEETQSTTELRQNMHDHGFKWPEINKKIRENKELIQLHLGG